MIDEYSIYLTTYSRALARLPDVAHVASPRALAAVALGMHDGSVSLGPRAKAEILGRIEELCGPVIPCRVCALPIEDESDAKMVETKTHERGIKTGFLAHGKCAAADAHRTRGIIGADGVHRPE